MTVRGSDPAGTVLVDGSLGFRCVGTWASVEDALEGLPRELPDVLLMDIQLPGMSGTAGVRIVRERHPSIEVLMLTIHAERERIFESICNGASGYLLKNTPPARLLECLKEVVSGGAPMSPEVARRVVRLFKDVRPPDRASYRLTPQETQLLKLLVEGYNYKTAAAELALSVHTVSFHMRNIYSKLQVHSKSEAVAKALRHRIV